jgi:hypothetical protein
VGLLLLLFAVVCGSLACNSSADDEAKGEPEKSKGSVYPVRFEDVSARAGLADFHHVNGAAGKKWFPETMGPGCGVLDYNLDGWPDLVLIRGAMWKDNTVPVLALFRNTGEKSFVEVTAELGLAELRAYGLGLTIGDYDNDGDPDIFLSNVGRNYLLRNDGGKYTDVGSAAGLAEDDWWSSSAMWFDADLDGWLDLYIGNYVEWSPATDIRCSIDGVTKSYCTPELYTGITSQFFHNNGDGTFSDWTERAGFGNGPGKTLGTATFDFNHDGWPDVVVANDTQRDELYINRGDGTFDEKGTISGIAFDESGNARGGMGVDVGVVDNSGEESVFIGNFAKEMIGVYRHVGGGFFTERAASSKIGRPSLMTLTFGLKLFDADLDGDLDLFTANGHIIEQVEKAQDGITFKQRPHLFLNDGDGEFTDAASQSGSAFQTQLVARGIATLDYDRDGDLDILVVENNGPVHLWESNASQVRGGYVKVSVTGTESNRSGYGTQLRAVVGEKRMYRRIRSGSSYLSHSEAVAVFGLGGAAKMDSLIVRWPAGSVLTLVDISADADLNLVENAEPRFILD